MRMMLCLHKWFIYVLCFIRQQTTWSRRFSDVRLPSNIQYIDKTTRWQCGTEPQALVRLGKGLCYINYWEDLKSGGIRKVLYGREREHVFLYGYLIGYSSYTHSHRRIAHQVVVKQLPKSIFISVTERSPVAYSNTEKPGPCSLGHTTQSVSKHFATENKWPFLI